MESHSMSTKLTAFLDSYDSLTEQDQATALQLILRKQGQAIKAPSSSELEDSSPVDAHTCYICARFTIAPSVGLVSFTSALWHTFTKEMLLQGLKRHCLLIEWVLSILGRHLTEFKGDLAQRGITQATRSSYDAIQSASDDLKYINTDHGVCVHLRFTEGKQKCGLLVSYDAEPSLLEKLWNVSQGDDSTMSFENWANKYHGIDSEVLILYTDADNPAATIIPVRPAKRQPDIDDRFELARNWLTDCQQNHDSCSKRDGTLPSRVIDVGTHFPVRTVNLYWPEEGEKGRYVALTYCWGGEQPLVTTRKTAQNFTDGIPTSRLPQTLLDAVNLTHKLGLRYLWIDCLCIIQDDAEDVSAEISRMAQIYQEAYVTVSAARARSVHEGFLSPRRVVAEPSVRVSLEHPNFTGSAILQQLRTYSRANDPIHLRAWTLQEHVLSPKILVFGTQALWWTCEDRTCNDGDHEGNNKSLSNLWGNSGVNEYSLSFWRSLVRDYSRRFLTFPNDKLPGIAGVAADYSRMFSGAYLAGLWEFSLVSELLWCSNRSDITRPTVQRAPSWSWASVDGEINHKWCPVDMGYNFMKIVSCQVTPVSALSPFGRVDPRRSMLQVDSDIAPVYWDVATEKLFRMASDEPGGGEKRVDIGRAQADAFEDILGTGTPLVWAMVVVRQPLRGLLLSEVGDDIFRRVGIFFRVSNERCCQFERKIVSIV